MSRYSNILQLSLEYESILEESLNKGEHIIEDAHEAMYSCFLSSTSKKEWNEKIIAKIDDIKKDYIGKINLYDKYLVLNIRNLIQIYKENYVRIDSFDIDKMTAMQVNEYYDGPRYDKMSIKMSFFVSESLRLTNLIIKSAIDYSANDEGELNFKLEDKVFENDITEIINLTYSEVVADYVNSCYISAISLCGKIIETMLFGLYRELYPKSSDRDKLSNQSLVEKIRQKGCDLGIVDDHIKVIARRRNKNIHGNVVFPTCDEARGVISLTKDVLIRTIAYKSSLPSNDPTVKNSSL